jgi:hypothetical protein
VLPLYSRRAHFYHTSEIELVDQTFSMGIQFFQRKTETVAVHVSKFAILMMEIWCLVVC